MNIKLSKRLQAIADWVPAGSRLADIGTDHALLPAYLVQQGKITYGIVGEVNEGPYVAARQTVAGLCLEQVIDVRLGDGLAVLQANEVDCITIAGMGGGLIARILAVQPEKLCGVKRLILQPNVAADKVRRWLFTAGWALLQEHILQEDGKIYEFLLAERLAPITDVQVYYEHLYKPRMLESGLSLTTDWLMQFGPLLSLHPSAVFLEKWQREIDKLDYILCTLQQAKTTEAVKQRAIFLQKRLQLEEILTCLHMDK